MVWNFRLAVERDTQGLITLALQGAEARASLDRKLWPGAADAEAIVAASLKAAIARPGGPFFWLVGEEGGQLRAYAHLALIPPPPIYDLGGRPAGILLDDTGVAADAPPGGADGLVVAAQSFLLERGAAIIIAACPSAAAEQRRYLDCHGYKPVTRYLVRHTLRKEFPDGVRLANVDDLDAIRNLGRAARAAHLQAEPRMWTAHLEADVRFLTWMRHSLNMQDRTVLVTPKSGDVNGFAVAQPAGPFQLPLTCARNHLGLVDDFQDGGFEHCTGEGADQLLAAAEATFHARKMTSAMVICPAGYEVKSDFLGRRGYAEGNLWLLKN